MRQRASLEQAKANQLKCTVESQRGCRAALTQTVRVRETFQNQPVWQGVVHVLELEGHPKDTHTFAWSSPIEASYKRRFFAVLQLGAIKSPPRCGAGGDRGRAEGETVRSVAATSLLLLTAGCATLVVTGGGTTIHIAWYDWVGLALIILVCAYYRTVVAGIRQGASPVELLGKIGNVVGSLVRRGPN